MKALKTIGLLALAVMNFTSCDLFFGHREPSFISYNLGLSFQDASGNDLVKGIELKEWWPSGVSMENARWGSVNPDLYVLDIIVFEPCENWDNDIYNAPARPSVEPDVNRPRLTRKRYSDGYYYLTNSFSLQVGDCPEEKILTYKLKCPYVFGDEAIHELVTYWDIPKTKSSSGSDYYAKCYRIVFEGNEIAPQPPVDKIESYVATILWDVK